MTNFVWVHNEETDGYAQIPEDSVEHMRAMGWEPSDAPEPGPNPAVAEALAWREEQAALQAEEQAAAKAESKSRRNKE